MLPKLDVGFVVEHALILLNDQPLLFGVEGFLKVEGEPDLLEGPPAMSLRLFLRLGKPAQLFQVVSESHQRLFVHLLVDAQHRKARGSRVGRCLLHTGVERVVVQDLPPLPEALAPDRLLRSLLLVKLREDRRLQLSELFQVLRRDGCWLALALLYGEEVADLGLSRILLED